MCGLLQSPANFYRHLLAYSQSNPHSSYSNLEEQLNLSICPFARLPTAGY